MKVSEAKKVKVGKAIKITRLLPDGDDYCIGKHRVGETAIVTEPLYRSPEKGSRWRFRAKFKDHCELFVPVLMVELSRSR